MIAATLALPTVPVTLASVSQIDLSHTPWRRIELSERDGIWCLVDAEDYGWLVEKNWNVSWGSRTRWQLYAKRNVGVARATVRMHREIMIKAEPRDDDIVAALHVDHVNGCTLDNRRKNLRWATPAENRANTRAAGERVSIELILYRLLHQHQTQIQSLQEMPF
jgi:hypothetical protein